MYVAASVLYNECEGAYFSEITKNFYQITRRSHPRRLDRQCMYSATLSRVRTTIVVVEKQYVLHILSVYL
jgi:hypothetical protein